MRVGGMVPPDAGVLTGQSEELSRPPGPAGHVLGVDAGNTKTIALVARIGGAIVGYGRAGCGDIYGAASADTALAAIDAAVDGALALAGVDRADLAAGAFSLAGADWPEDMAFLEAAMRRRGYGRARQIVNDALGALRASSDDGTGVALVCGTGAAIGARASDGRVWHTSHWQEPHGSEDLGRKTLRAVYRADLGIDPPTALTGRVCACYHCPTVEEVLHRFTARDRPRPTNVAHLARILIDEAENGDATARRIVREHGAALGDYVAAAARRVGLAGMPYTLGLCGGVLRGPSTMLADAVIARVRELTPGARPARSPFEPVVGSLFMALELAGCPITAPVRERIAGSLPPPGIFAT